MWWGGGGGGLKFEKKNARKTIESTPKKKLGIGSPVFCTFSFTLVLFDYWIFHNRSSKIIGQKVSIDDRL